MVLGGRSRGPTHNRRRGDSEAEVHADRRNIGYVNDGASDNYDQGANDNYGPTSDNDHLDFGTPDNNRSANDDVDESSATSDDFAPCSCTRGGSTSARASKLLPPDQRRELL